MLKLHEIVQIGARNCSSSGNIGSLGHNVWVQLPKRFQFWWMVRAWPLITNVVDGVRASADESSKHNGLSSASSTERSSVRRAKRYAASNTRNHNSLTK